MSTNKRTNLLNLVSSSALILCTLMGCNNKMKSDFSKSDENISAGSLNYSSKAPLSADKAKLLKGIKYKDETVDTNPTTADTSSGSTSTETNNSANTTSTPSTGSVLPVTSADTPASTITSVANTTPVANASSLASSTSDTSTTSKYDLNFMQNFSMVDEVIKMSHGDFSNPTLLFLLLQHENFSEAEFQKCLTTSGRPSDSCYATLGEANLGYGLCMSNRNKSRESCIPALGTKRTGFGLCMAAGRSYNECQEALNEENLGFGICMAAGRRIARCRLALHSQNIGFGFCMANLNNDENDCRPDLINGGLNIGYGLCMAGGRDRTNCEKALGKLNIGFGLCMMNKQNKFDRDCQIALNGNINTGFGLCTASDYVTKNSHCHVALNGNLNTGFGLCMSAGRDRTNCGKALTGGDNLGFGLCMMNPQNSYDVCSRSLNARNTGFGLCIESNKVWTQCNDALGAENIGYGLCMMPDDHTYNGFASCNDVLAPKKEGDMGFGMCKTGSRSMGNCNVSLDNSVREANTDFVLTMDGVTTSLNNQKVDSRKNIKIDLKLNIEYQNLYRVADVYIVVMLQKPNGKEVFYQKNGATFNFWDKNFNSLGATTPDYLLNDVQQFPVFEGALSDFQGVTFTMYYGYRYQSAPITDIHYNKDRQISFTVQ